MLRLFILGSAAVTLSLGKFTVYEDAEHQLDEATKHMLETDSIPFDQTRPVYDDVTAALLQPELDNAIAALLVNIPLPWIFACGAFVGGPDTVKELYDKMELTNLLSCSMGTAEQDSEPPPAHPGHQAGDPSALGLVTVPSQVNSADSPGQLQHGQWIRMPSLGSYVDSPPNFESPSNFEAPVSWFGFEPPPSLEPGVIPVTSVATPTGTSQAGTFDIIAPSIGLGAAPMNSRYTSIGLPRAGGVLARPTVELGPPHVPFAASQAGLEVPPSFKSVVVPATATLMSPSGALHVYTFDMVAPSIGLGAAPMNSRHTSIGLSRARGFQAPPPSVKLGAVSSSTAALLAGVSQFGSSSVTAKASRSLFEAPPSFESGARGAATVLSPTGISQVGRSSGTIAKARRSLFEAPPTLRTVI